MSEMIDFRSDASSLPSDAQRRAMAEAEVGNDDFSDDPTVGRLEERIAELLHKEAAVFVQSGTMANVLAVMCHSEGQRVLISKQHHIFYHEGEAMRRLARCEFDFLPDSTRDGVTRIEYEKEPESEADVSKPTKTGHRLLCLENSVNRLGGTVLKPDHLAEIYQWASKQDLRVHLDGARLFNAACALDVEPHDLATWADSVMVVFTKALTAPAGGALVGPAETIERARHFRWMLGGNWKQGGVLAAACLAGLDSMKERVSEDHRHARLLAEGLDSIPGVEIELENVVTNIVLMRLSGDAVDPDKFKEFMQERGVLLGRFKSGKLTRLVTYKDIGKEDIERFVGLVRQAVSDPVNHNLRAEG